MEYVKSLKNKLLNTSPEIDNYNGNDNDNFSKIDTNKYFNLNNVSKFYPKKNSEDKNFIPQILK